MSSLLRAIQEASTGVSGVREANDRLSTELRRVREILSAAGKKCGTDPKLDLLSFDADGALYRLSALSNSLDGKRQLAETALADLDAAGITLGRLRLTTEPLLRQLEPGIEPARLTAARKHRSAGRSVGRWT